MLGLSQCEDLLSCCSEVWLSSFAGRCYTQSASGVAAYIVAFVMLGVESLQAAFELQ